MSTAQVIERDVKALERSTRTLLAFMSPAHNWIRARSRLYHRWHTHPQAVTVHWVTLAVATLVAIAAVLTALLPNTVRAIDYTITTNSTWCDAGDLPTNIGNLTINSGVTVTIGGTTGNAVNGGNTGGTAACVYEAPDSNNVSFTVTGTGTLTVNGTLVLAPEISGATGGHVKLNFANITVAAGGTIQANGQGFTGGNNSAGNGPGGGGFTANGGAGGGYGGVGGDIYPSNSPSKGGTTYGTSATPNVLGSGGGSNTSGQLGGAGGGVIELYTSGTLSVGGTITAKGGDAAGAGSGGGSGGSIYVIAGTLTGGGSFAAHGGGVPASNNSGGGGGGRIAIYYVTNSTFGGFNASDANIIYRPADTPGSPTAYFASYELGAAGTIGFIQLSNTSYLTNVAGDAAKSLSIYKQNFDYPADTTASFNNITVGAGSATGINLTLGGNSTITLSGTLTVTSSSKIIAQSKTNVANSGVTINTATATINSGSSISADGNGYTGGNNLAGNGPGGGGKNANGGAGGGYGGVGGNVYTNPSPTLGGATYGSTTAPTELGSGGGSTASGQLGGAGGGAIKLNVTGTLTLNGTLTANGNDSGGASSGGGSGGSIYVTVGTLTGSGSMTANGGKAASGNNSGSGGGGIIAVFYNALSSNTTTRAVNSPSNGSQFAYEVGSAGTIKFGSRATAALTAPAAGAAGLATTPDLTFTVTDYDNRTVTTRAQWKSNASNDCSAVDWTIGVTTKESSVSATGWSGSGSYINTSGGVSVTYTIQAADILTGQTWYCWRAAAKSATGDYTSYGPDATGQSFLTNVAPTVSAVSASQGSNGVVTVNYSIADSDDGTLKMTLAYQSGATLSDNPLSAGATTINISDGTLVPTSGYIQIDSEIIQYTGKTSNALTGATRAAKATLAASHNQSATIWLIATTVAQTGSSVDADGVITVTGVTGTAAAKTATWTAKTDRNGVYNSALTMRVMANDQAPGANTGSADTAGFALDTKNPTGVSVQINANAAYTNSRNVTLTNAATDDSSLQMQFSNDNITFGTVVDANGTVTDGGTFKAFTTSQAWTLPVGDGSKTVYLRVSDTKGNTAAVVSAAITFDGTAPTAATNLRATDVSITSTSTYRATLDWSPSSDTNFQNYVVQRATDGVTFSDITTISSITTNVYSDTGLNSSTTYTYRVKTNDLAGNNNTSGTITIKPGGPTVSIVAAGTPGITSATITWTTDTAGNSLIDYGTDTSYGSGTIGNTSESVTSHSVTIQGLSAGTSYKYRVRSRNAARQETTDNNSGSGYSFTTATDTTPPTITSGPSSSNLGDTTATITWVTNEASDSKVQYGTSSGSYPSSTTLDSNLNLSHTVVITGLTATTKYYYKVKSKDAAGNLQTSAEFTFTTTGDTTPPILSSITTAPAAAGTSATITWTTDEASTSEVYYDTVSRASYNLYVSSSKTSDQDINHRRNLTSLSTGTTYYYRVRSVDAAGNATVNNEATFTTATFPTVSSVASSALTKTTATITWTSNVAGDSMVDFGTTTGTYTASQGNTADSVTSHTVILSGLISGKTYYYRAKTHDVLSNLATSAESSFSTTNDTTPPTVTVTINNSAAYTTSGSVTLALTAADTGEGGVVADMRFSNDGVTYSNFETYTGTKTWDLTNATYGGSTAQGTKTAYVQVRDNSGNTSTAATATIVYDSIAPSANQPSVTSPTNNTRPDLSWTASTDTNGINGYYLKIGTTDGGTETLAETFIGNVTTYRPAALSQGTYYAAIKAKDSAGNTGSYSSTRSFVIDTTAPTGSISIAAGAAYTTSNLVTLTLSATDTGGAALAQMQFSNSPTGPFSTLETYATSKTNWNLTDATLGGSSAEGTKTVYARFTDTAGNTSLVYADDISYDGTVPILSSITTAPAAAGTSATITWTTDEASTSEVYYDTVSRASYNLYVSSSKTSDQDINHRRNLTSLSTGTTYYYRVRSVDAAGNATVNNEATFTTATFPTVSSVASSALTKTTATITWTSNVAGDSMVDFGTTTGTYTASQGNTADSVTSHTVILSGLTSGKTYYYRAATTDALGNPAKSTEGSFTTTTDTTPPTITSGPSSSNLGDTTATITWVTDEASDSQVVYGTSSGNYPSSTTLDSNLNLSHTVVITGLAATTKYYYKVKSKDAAGNLRTSDEGQFTTTGNPPPPIISAIVATSSKDGKSITVTWTTDTDATSIVEYGPSSSYGSTSGDVGKTVKSHTATLADLSEGTGYHYRVRSRDTAGSETVSADQTLTTASDTPVISALTVTPADTSAVVSWTTSENSTSLVSYGTISSNLDKTASDTTSTIRHSVTLSNLAVATTYTYKASSTDDAGKIGTSDVSTFTTLATPSTTGTAVAPKISADGPVVKDVHSTEAEIQWKTDLPSDSIVTLGTKQGSYVSSQGDTSQISADHKVPLVGLQPQTTYYYQVKSRSSDGVVGTSTEKTFTTPARPAIATVAITDIGLTSAIVSWDTSTVTTSVVELGETSSYGSTITDRSGSQTTKHTVRLGDLKSGFVYHLRVSGTDANGTQVASDDYTFTTIALPGISNVSVVGTTETMATIAWDTNVPTDTTVEFGEGDKLGDERGRAELVTKHNFTLANLKQKTRYVFRAKGHDRYGNQVVSETGSLITQNDTKGPVITDIKAEPTSVTSATGSRINVIISFVTDEPASSQVEYGTGLGANYEKKTKATEGLNQSHIIILTDLSPSTTYHFRVKATDGSGNDSTSNDYTVLTPPREDSVLQVIVGSLEQTFSWLPKLSGGGFSLFKLFHINL